jgi:hypothetical protein
MVKLQCSRLLFIFFLKLNIELHGSSSKVINCLAYVLVKNLKTLAKEHDQGHKKPGGDHGDGGHDDSGHHSLVCWFFVFFVALVSLFY